MKKLLNILLCSVVLTGCATINEQDMAMQDLEVQTAVTIASFGCIKLSDALKPQEICDVEKSLIAARSIIQGDASPDIAKKIANIDTNVAPFAPVIAGWILVGKNALPQNSEQTLEFRLAKDIIDSCYAIINPICMEVK